MSATSSGPPSASTSPNGGTTQNNSGPSSPLLFFVALGFGVVFTNLWIIVGVKYCFRYNQRNRARLNGEDPDAVDMAAMPRQRRRREKKLMTMDEVNERFPLVKYKAWRSTRAEKGLPTAGGIAGTTSRPASIKNETRVSEDEGEDKEKRPISSEEPVPEKAGSSEHGPPEIIRNDTDNTISDEQQRPATAASNRNPAQAANTTEEDEEDVDQIQTAIPAEQLPDPGDMCAICIDTIEDDDDIRGLSCGHAFHASCVDPWLTSRRACCPLCKADYYVPKPRPEGETDEQRRQNPNGTGAPHPTYTILAHSRGGRITRAMVIPTRLLSGNPQAGHGHRTRSASERRRRRGERNNGAATANNASNNTTIPEVSESQDPAQNQTPSQEQRSWRQRLGNVRLPTIPPISRMRTGRNNEPGQQPPTPGQIEEGRAS